MVPDRRCRHGAHELAGEPKVLQVTVGTAATVFPADLVRASEQVLPRPNAAPRCAGAQGVPSRAMHGRGWVPPRGLARRPPTVVTVLCGPATTRYGYGIAETLRNAGWK